MISIFVFIAAACNAYGQAQLLTIEDGLSNKNVTAILQTRNGYLWVGTETGLNRYNGYTFYEFGRHNGLSSGKINCLYEDRHNKLWIGTWQGLNILDQKTGAVKQFFQNEIKQAGSIQNTNIRCIGGSADGSVIVTFDNGLVLQFSDENHFKKVFTLPDNGNKAEIKVMHLAPDTSLYLITNYGVITRLGKNFAADTNFEVDAPDVIAMDSYNAGKTLILVTVYGKILHVSAKTGAVLRSQSSLQMNLPNDLLTAACISGNRFMWTGYSEGSFAYTDISSNVLTNHTAETRNLITGASTVIYPDRNGVLWIGSNYGLVKFSPKGHHFENYLFAKGEIYKNKNSMRGMVEDAAGDIYAGGYNGLFRLRKGDTAVKHFLFKDLGRANENAYFPYRLLDDGPYIWISSEVKGFYRFNKTKETLEFPLKHLDFFRGYALLKGPGNLLWLGTHRGLYLYDKEKNSIRKHNPAGDAFGTDAIEVTELRYDADSNLWIGTYSTGLFRMNKQRHIDRHYSEANTSRPLNFVTALYAENDTTLWVGTREGGLGRMNPRSGKIIFYTKKNGLADNSVAAIVKDNSGILWVSTFNGLSRLNTSSGEFENYYAKDGLTESEFNIASSLKAKDGKMYFGGLNGINAFYPAELLKKQNTKPNIFLCGFTKYDGSNDRLIENAGDLSELGDISLSHRDKFFSFTFALDNYYDPLRNTFFYKLEDYDADWTNLGTQNSIRFNSLPAGDYRLQIKGVNSEGTTSANILNFRIHVSSPFYNSWWFYLLVLLVTILLVYTITRYRIYQGLK